MNKYYEQADLIPGKIEPSIGSLKYINIDGYLSEKCMYDGSKWIPICRHNNCTEENYKDELCQDHYKIQLKINVDDELVKKGSKFYKWSINEWKPICSVKLCENYATKNGHCRNHKKNKPTIYSSNQTFSSIYNLAKQEIFISRQKKKKLMEFNETNTQ